MIRLRSSVRSPLQVPELVELILAQPRWNGWRDGIDHRPFLIAEKSPFEVTKDGFRFVVRSSRRIAVVCRGQFHASGSGTRIDLDFSPHRDLLTGLVLSVLPIMAVFIVVMWTVNPWLAISGALAIAAPVSLLLAIGFWWNAREVRRRLTEFLTSPQVGSGVSIAPHRDAEDGGA